MKFLVQIILIAMIKPTFSESNEPEIDYRYRYFKFVPTQSSPKHREVKIHLCSPKYDGVESCRLLKTENESCLKLTPQSPLFVIYQKANNASWVLINEFAEFSVNASMTILFAALGLDYDAEPWDKLEFGMLKDFRKKHRILKSLNHPFLQTAEENKKLKLSYYLNEKELKRYKKKKKLPKDKPNVLDDIAKLKQQLIAKYNERFRSISKIELGINPFESDLPLRKQKAKYNSLVFFDQSGKPITHLSRSPIDYLWLKPAGAARPRLKPSDFAGHYSETFYYRFNEVFKPLSYTLKQSGQPDRQRTFTPDTTCLP